MGLIEEEIKELRSLDGQFIKDNNGHLVDKEYIMARIAIFSQIHKREALIVQVEHMAAKFGKKVSNRIERRNVLGDSQAIETNTDPEIEMIKCPEKDFRLVSRNECLDYSGTHNEECTTCDHKPITQNRLLGSPDTE